MVLAKASQDFQLTLNSRQKHFGVTNFKVEVINLADGSVLNVGNVNVVEVIKNVSDPKTATVTADALKGTKTIKVKDSTLVDGMVFNDGNGNLYYIEEIDDDGATIKTRVPLVADIAANATLTEVGNTGIYKIPLNISVPGKYNVVISNPSVNLRNLAAFVEIMKYDIDDLGNKIDSQAQNIVDKINEVKAEVSQTDSSDYEIVS